MYNIQVRPRYYLLDRYPIIQKITLGCHVIFHQWDSVMEGSVSTITENGCNIRSNQGQFFVKWVNIKEINPFKLELSTGMVFRVEGFNGICVIDAIDPSRSREELSIKMTPDDPGMGAIWERWNMQYTIWAFEKGKCYPALIL